MGHNLIIPLVAGWIFCFFFDPFCLNGQKPVNCYQDIAMVRLYLNNPKQRYLKNAYAQAKGQNAAAQIGKQLTAHDEDRSRYVKNTILYFKQFYPVGDKILFIPDSLWADFKAGVERPYFLNENGTLQTDIIVPASITSYYVIGRGDFDEDFYAFDQNGNQLSKPFPYKIKHTLMTKMGTLFSDPMKVSVERYCRQIAKYCEAR